MLIRVRGFCKAISGKKEIWRGTSVCSTRDEAREEGAATAGGLLQNWG